MVAPEKLATALPATDSHANCGRQAAANDQEQALREATSSRSASMQSAWRGGSGSASRNACSSFTARPK